MTALKAFLGKEFFEIYSSLHFLCKGDALDGLV